MEKWRGKSAVVIGANSGIGACVMTNFLENGITVYAWDKEITNLQELKETELGENLTIQQTDITVDDEVQNSVEYLKENSTSIDIFIFSAGIIENNSMIDGEFSEWEEILNTNLIGFSVCMKGVIGVMLEQNVKNGQVIIMSSKTAVQLMYLQKGHYFAAIERGIMAIIEAIRYELKERKSPIKVSAINAGLVRTNLFKSDVAKALLNVCIPLTTDDVMEAVEYILSTPPNLLINRVVVSGRGILKQHVFKEPGDQIQDRIKKFIRRRA